MFETNLLFYVAGIVSTFVFAAAWIEIPKIWKWFKFQVWYDMQYSRGYVAGVEEGRRVERRWADES